MAHAVRAGVVWVNDHHRSDPASPRGGFKMSGPGHEKGLEEVRGDADVKSIWVSLDDQPIRWHDDARTQRLN